MHGFDTNTYNPKGGNATYGFAAKARFAGQQNHGVTARLEGALGEELQIIISELMNNTNNGNLTVEFKAEGSELQG